MITGDCGTDPVITARCLGIPLVPVLVVALGRFLAEDDNEHDDENDSQERLIAYAD